MSFFHSILMIAACTGIMVQTAPVEEGHRDKRSDDIPALQSVVEGLTQQVSQLSAQIISLRNKDTALETRISKNVFLLLSFFLSFFLYLFFFSLLFSVANMFISVCFSDQTHIKDCFTPHFDFSVCSSELSPLKKDSVSPKHIGKKNTIPSNFCPNFFGLILCYFIKQCCYTVIKFSYSGRYWLFSLPFFG